MCAEEIENEENTPSTPVDQDVMNEFAYAFYNYIFKISNHIYSVIITRFVTLLRLMDHHLLFYMLF